MKLGTITIPAIALTVEEERALWKEYHFQRQFTTVESQPIEQWHTDDGSNELLLRGEEFYRPIVRPNSPNFKPD